MVQRILTGAIGAVVFIGVLVLGGIVFQLAAALVALVALYELFKMRGLPIVSLEGLLAALAAVSLVLSPTVNLLRLGTDGSLMLFTLFVFIMLIVMAFSDGRYSFEDVAFPFLAAFYVGIGLQSLVFARQRGIFIVLLAVFIVWATDIGAYFVGRSLGRHKLAPKISPNKTIEGSIGGIVAALVIAALMLVIFRSYAPAVPLWQLLVLTVIFSCLSQLGDLVESSIKRHYGVKDSGNILPGHGGILDRFDSMIFVFPMMHLFGLF